MVLESLQLIAKVVRARYYVMESMVNWCLWVTRMLWRGQFRMRSQMVLLDHLRKVGKGSDWKPPLMLTSKSWLVRASA